MTDYQRYPEERFTLPEGGKVTGTAVAIFRGDGSVLIRTEGAHINDNNPAVDYRGESFLVHLETFRQDDGTFVVHPEYGTGSRGANGGVTRRQNWSDAPASFARAIIAAILDYLPNVWTPELERAGLEADVAQTLHSLERTADEQSTELRKTRAAIRAAARRLS